MKEVEIDEREGKPSASGAPRWVPCTASFKFEAAMPDENKACLRRGLKIHYAMERSDLSFLSYSDAICAERLMYHEGRLVDKYGLEGAEVIKEKRFWHSDRSFSARIDSIHMTKEVALVINYKTGFYEQEKIDKDWQCAAEASVVWTNLKPKRVIIAKIHPNYDPGYQAKVCDMDTLGRATERLNASALLAMSEDAEFNPGPAQCQWCLGKKYGTCWAYQEWSEEHGS